MSFYSRLTKKMFSCCCCLHFQPCLPNSVFMRRKNILFKKLFWIANVLKSAPHRTQLEQSKFRDSVVLIRVSVSFHTETPAASALTYVPKLSWNNYVTIRPSRLFKYHLRVSSSIPARLLRPVTLLNSKWLNVEDGSMLQLIRPALVSLSLPHSFPLAFSLSPPCSLA